MTSSPGSDPLVLPDCEPWSHTAGSSLGVLVVHGFTGAPAGMRLLGSAFADAGFDVELPRLPGHGTSIDDMLTTGWADWAGEVGHAHARLARRVDRVVALGQSMGGLLVLDLALTHPELAGLMCINPITRRRDPAEMAMVEELLDDGMTVVPSEGSDIADPEAVEISYRATPLAPLLSLVRDGVEPITDRFGELSVPLHLFTSRNDHVVAPADSEHLAATYGGPVDHVWLERGFHVAAVDYDRHIICERAVGFAAALGGVRGIQ